MLENVTFIAYAQVILGAILIIVSSVVDRSESFAKKAADWKAKIHTQAGGIRPLVQLAFGAGFIELATMLPYLAAIGILLKQVELFTVQATTLAVYVFLMILPAFVLLLLRICMNRRSIQLLERINLWLSKNTGEMVKTFFVLVGILMVADGLKQLSIFPFN